MLIPKTKKIQVEGERGDCSSNVNRMDSTGAQLDLVGLQRVSKRKHFKANEVIYYEGEDADRIYVIHDGLVKLLSYLKNGKGRIVRLYAKQGWLGLEGLVGQTYKHTAIAIGNSDMVSIPRHSLRLLEQNNPRQYCYILQKGYGYLDEADKWISEFSTGEIKPRVARLLAFLSQLEYGKSAKVVDLLTVHEMADMLGVTPESVSRILAQFKRDDILHKVENCADKGYAMNWPKLQYEARQ